MVETVNVSDCVDDGVFGTGLHQEAYKPGIKVEIRHKGALIDLPAQFEREVAGKGGHSHASLGPHHSNRGPRFRRSDFRDSLAGSANGVPQRLYEKRAVTDALHYLVVFGAVLYFLQRERLRFPST
jgi:hypothetical protein